MKKLITIHNIETGEVIEREMTTAEIAEDTEKFTKAQAERVAEEAEATAKAQARAAVLSKLGLTAEEAASLLA